ncbi:MAG: ABC transporter permease [Syntrophaceae bacterium]|nr:ABC transporter permease [Syntrophaceae bacterium]
MQTADLATVALRQIYRNKRRYKAVLIGIALGIAGIIIILTMGGAVESDLGSNLELLGSATIVKAYFDYSKSPKKHGGQYFLKDVEDLEKLPGVRHVSPAVFSSYPVSYNLKKIPARLLGVDEKFFDTIHIPMAQGRRITEDDVSWKNNVCVVGSTIVRILMGDEPDPLNKQIFIGGHYFRIVGIIGGVEDPSFMESILIPLSVARSRFPGMYEIKDIYVRAINWDVIEDLEHKVYEVLVKNQPGYSEAMEVRVFSERIKTIKRAALIVKLFVYAALIVIVILGGLGITNVMLAAVRERTKEIGLRKAVGATEEMIMNQFLVEAVTLSLVGALIGIITGTISVEILKIVLKTTPSYSMFILSVIGGVIFGFVLGISSGYLPARKASKLDAAEAMRFE